MAILAALHSPDLDVLGLTTVFGNTEVELCSLNALRLVELEGNDHIPVAQGCGQPLVHDINSFSAGVHGKDGFGNTNLPIHASSIHATLPSLLSTLSWRIRMR